VVEIEESRQVSQVFGLDVTECGFVFRALLGVPSPSRPPWGGFWVLDLLKRFWV
jgi:hypothetical protein